MILVFVFNGNFLVAQIENNKGNYDFSNFCITPESPIDQRNIYSQPKSILPINHLSNFCLNIKFHVVRNSDGSDFFSSPNINSAMNRLNNDFNQHRIYFNNLGTTYINNSDFLTINSVSHSHQMTNAYNVANTLNVYIVFDIFGNAGGFVYNIPSTTVVIKRSMYASHAISHEIGHALDLHHTHATNFGVEAINGSNCWTAGDLICDTPADPGLIPYSPDPAVNYNVDQNCNYIGGGGYNPLVENIMSYSWCFESFTNYQGYRMREALLNNNLLQSIISNNCLASVLSFDNDKTICLNQNKTFTFYNPNNLTVNWIVSSDLTVINNNNQEITVQLNNFNNVETTIEASITQNGITNYFVKRLEKLETPNNSSITLMSQGSTVIYTDRWTNITARYNGQITLDKFEWEWVVPASQYTHSYPMYSYIHVKPLVNYNTSIYLQTKASNECGCTDWVGQWFDVQYHEPCNDCPPFVIHY